MSKMMNATTKVWLRYLVIMFEARAIQLHADEEVEAAHYQAAAFEMASSVLMLALRAHKPLRPQELAGIFGDGFPPIAELMLAEVLKGADAAEILKGAD